MKKCLSIFKKLSLSFLLLLAALVCVFSVSPIYDFSAPEPFSGPDIYNPYAGLPSNAEWKKANLHTHTRVDNILNECPGYPSEVYSDYMKLGYDVLAFTNHNSLTQHPFDSTLQINAYEHGYNLFKLHKQVYNPSAVMHIDHLLPFLVSQKQWQYDYLARNADFIVMNHPDRTKGMGKRSMRLLTGYRLMEADSGASTGLCRWDEALSAGHYSHCLINDDCHDSGNHAKIAKRCSWLNTPSASYEDIKETLLAGRFYSMRIPDFGVDGRKAKLKGNDSLPRVEAIGLKRDTVFMRLSAPARIEAWGQGHELLACTDGCSFERRLAEDEPYMRLSAFFDNGVVIYSNVFARYDSSESESPYKVADHKLNVLLTVLFNVALICLLLLFACSIFKLWKAD